ncbi:MAG: magnesium transporter CorA family protein [Lachnospiraceae bacterium]|nr:magnesium transporter CorA family protein [Lachnospiraceae bacterium]
MISIYRTDDNIIHELQEYEEGTWICMTKPSIDEIQSVAQRFSLDPADVRAALDDEESARVSLEDDYTLILVDIPMSEVRNNTEAYTTFPLGIILTMGHIITVCAEETPILNYFVKSTVRDFSTKKQMRFLYQILYRCCVTYQMYLRNINRKRIQVEERINEKTEDSDLINLHELESNLVYFATSLRGNGAVLERLTRYERIKQYPEDKDLLEDVLIENKQAIEMTQIYRDIINGTRELMSAVLDNRLNITMKYLTAITIVMAIPNIVSGLYGMNLNSAGMPFVTWESGFAVICCIILVICAISMWVLRKTKMM